MNNTEILPLAVPLGRESHTLARELAARAMQLTTLGDKHQIGKRVFLNILAVYAVDSYLRWQGYEPNFSQSDSADPILCSRWDVADLMLPGIGKLECRPIWEGETVLIIPSEATEDRIGYFAVQFGEHLERAKLLGFAPMVDASNPPTFVPIANLQTLDYLIDYLYRLEVANQFLQGDDLVAVRVREVMANNQISEIAAQLERIWRIELDSERPYAIKDILAGTATGVATEREFVTDDETDIELLELAESLIEKLSEIWSNTDFI
ncbi:DUF1822 family protein [Floridanema aerugineum]|uniref:DUF1822 family protein n=1 Tax=Floridaenema aerugineum BLCC-F46 TaxID=3153654 RepID=A0ABV4WXQ1_9CYAN